MAKTIRELEQELGAKREALRQKFEKATVDGQIKMSREEVDEAKQANAELKDLGEELEALRDAEAMRRALPDAPDDGRKSGDGGPPAGKGKARSVREVIEGSEGLKRFKAQRTGTVALDFTEEEYKTLITLSDMTPQADRAATVPYAQPYVPVSDLFLQGTTDRSSLEYYEQTTQTLNAAERAEGDALAESAFSWTLRTDPVRDIGSWVPLTEESMEDNGEMESVIRDRLMFDVAKRRDLQLISGDGTGVNLTGILSRGSILTQAKGSDPVFDTVMKAMTKVRFTGDAEPTAALFHPNDWQDLVLTRTTEGIYILGNPGDPQASQRLWGLTVRVVPALTENTGLLGAFRPYARFVRRRGLRVLISTEHSDYFIKNKVAIKADERDGLQVFRQAAFCSMTGI